MTNKNKLKGTKYYISHDCTTKERYIQQQIINIAHEERRKGKTITVE